MTGMRQAAGGYLAMRRALGFSLVREGRWLMSFIGYLEQQGAAHITTELAVAWATRTRPDVNPAHWNHRLTVVRIFARHLSALEPRTEIPPAELMPRHYQRVAPYLFTPEQIDALIRAAAGMRVGEACGLDRGDVDAGAGILTIRAGKLGKDAKYPCTPPPARPLAPTAGDTTSCAAVRRRPRSSSTSGAVGWPPLPGVADKPAHAPQPQERLLRLAFR